eukprot:1063488-Prorocentrum_minimum.AAC.1
MIHSRRHQQYQGDQQDKAESVSIQCGSSSPRVPMVRRFLVGFGSQDLAWGIRRRLLNVSSMIASSLLGFNDLLRTTARVECGSNLLGDSMWLDWGLGPQPRVGAVTPHNPPASRPFNGLGSFLSFSFAHLLRLDLCGAAGPLARLLLLEFRLRLHLLRLRLHLRVRPQRPQRLRRRLRRAPPAVGGRRPLLRSRSSLVLSKAALREYCVRRLLDAYTVDLL